MSMQFDESRLDKQPGTGVRNIFKVFSKLSGAQARANSVTGMAKGAIEAGKAAAREERAGMASELAALKKNRDAAYSDLKSKRRVLNAESGRIARSTAASADRTKEYADKAKTDVKKARRLAKIKANSSVGKPPAKPRRTTK